MAFDRPLRAITYSPQKRPSQRAAGVSESRIDGGFRKITTHQLVIVWWLYREGHITRRQLRVWFALQEMAERRECAHSATPSGTRRRQPSFGLEEVSALVGGKSAPEALSSLQGDLRRLERVGLATFTAHKITFAQSIEQIAISDRSSFSEMLEQFQNKSRSVPVPRRMVRALAGGFSRAVTAMIFAMLIRSLFWHNEGGYRVDGRTKGSWIAETFGISRRAVSDARAHLIALGWIQPLETAQWKLNKWGAHDVINASWKKQTEEGRGESEIASPPAENRIRIASPDLNSSPSTKILKTRNPERPGLTGFLTDNGKANHAIQGDSEASLRNVAAEHLSDTKTLLQLHAQATAAGLIDSSEASILTFFAFAERARAHGSRPGALFMWLLRGKRIQFITQVDEDAAHARLRELRNGRAEARAAEQRTSAPRVLTEDEKFYLVCIQVARRERISDPFRVAFIGKRWTREHWDSVEAQYRQAMQKQNFAQLTGV